jgi:hypothetical protein
MHKSYGYWNSMKRKVSFFFFFVIIEYRREEEVEKKRRKSGRSDFVDMKIGWDNLMAFFDWIVWMIMCLTNFYVSFPIMLFFYFSWFFMFFVFSLLFFLFSHHCYFNYHDISIKFLLSLTITNFYQKTYRLLECCL